MRRATPVTASAVEDWLAARIAALVNVARGDVPHDSRIESFGIDSAQAIALMVDLEDWLGLSDELPLELLFEADSIRAAAAAIAAAAAEMNARGQPAS